jgi:hypothetical protein
LFNIKNIKKTMKKMWLVAAIVCVALMVSCGGKKNEKKDAKGGVEAKAKEFVNKMYAAEKAGDEAAAAKLQAELEAYAMTLSEADLEAFEAAINKAVESIESSSECVAQAKTPDSACCVETDNASGATTTTANTATNTYTDEEIVAKATEMAKNMFAAANANDTAAADKIEEEFGAWINTLSEADQQVAINALQAAMADAISEFKLQ